jgi:hypothetical protein
MIKNSDPYIYQQLPHGLLGFRFAGSTGNADHHFMAMASGFVTFVQ